MTIEFENILNVTDDIKQLVRTWRNSKQVSKYMITNHFITIEEHEEWLQKLNKNTTVKGWIIIYDKKPVGLVSLSSINSEEKTTEWGMYIADESIRGKGIGSTTLYKLMEYVFDTLHFQMMSTSVLQNNDVAMKLYEKFGFRKDATKPEHLNRNGVIIDIVSMSISQEAWNKIRPTLKHLHASSLT